MTAKSFAQRLREDRLGQVELLLALALAVPFVAFLQRSWIVGCATVGVVAVSSMCGEGRLRMLAFGGIFLSLLREFGRAGFFFLWERTPQFLISLTWEERLIPIFLGLLVIGLLLVLSLGLPERRRVVFLVLAWSAIGSSMYFDDSYTHIAALRVSASYFWYGVLGISLLRRRAAEERQSLFEMIAVPLVWSSYWVPVPIVLGGDARLGDGLVGVEKRRKEREIRIKGLALLIFSAGLVFIGERIMPRYLPQRAFVLQWMFLTFGSMNGVVAVAWLSGFWIEPSAGRFWLASNGITFFKRIARYYSQLLETVFILPLFSALRRVRSFSLRIFLATFFGFSVGGAILHLSTVFFIRRELWGEYSREGRFVYYDSETWRLALYFVLIGFFVARSAVLVARKGYRDEPPLWNRLLRSSLYFLAFSAAATVTFFPSDWDALLSWISSL